MEQQHPLPHKQQERGNGGGRMESEEGAVAEEKGGDSDGRCEEDMGKLREWRWNRSHGCLKLDSHANSVLSQYFSTELTARFSSGR